MNDSESLLKQLAEPFDPAELKIKPVTVSGSRALVIHYVDARVIMDRLDAVLGLGGWQTSYRELAEGVVCRLRVRLGGEWCEHEDVGGFSEQPDEGDKMKAAYSDALKRVAVHLGIGRYLYRLPQQWLDYDPQKKRVTGKPTLPAWALPGNGKPQQVKKPANAPPANGAELRRRLLDYQDKLVEQKLCKAGDLIAHVIKAGSKAGHGEDLTTWNHQSAIALAVEETKQFEAACRKPRAPAAQQPAPPAEETPGDSADHDPAEIIGAVEVRELQTLMKQADRLMPKLIELFNRQGAGFPATAKLTDLSYHWYGIAKKALLKVIAEKAKQQPQAKAG